MHATPRVAAVLLAIALASCSAQPPKSETEHRAGHQSPTASPREPVRTLVMANRAEPPSIAAKRLESSSLTWGTTLRLANAYLALVDDQAMARPYLAEDLPRLNTDTWRVFPDGRMDTIYRLRPDLTWHDGARLTAEDVVFAWRLYTTPDLGMSQEPPQGLMEAVEAVDPRTVRIVWKGSYADAARITDDLPPLPRHVLEAAYVSSAERKQFDSLITHPFWSVGYVGAGPFRLEHWEPGAYIELGAFEGHALGRPGIDRIRLQFMSDANAVLASLLSGQVHMSVDDSIRFQQGVVLKRDWARGELGRILVYPTQWRYTYVQLRPELARPQSLTDARVRRALAHGLDRAALNDGLFEGEGMLTDTMIPPTAPAFADVDRAIARYPHDPRRAEQLMTEASFARGADGVYTSPTSGRFSTDIKILTSPHNDAEAAIMASGWRGQGFDVQEGAFTAAQGRDAQARATFNGMHTTSTTLGTTQLAVNHSSQIPTAENRWRGSNRAGWANAEYDRLFEAYSTTLDQPSRNQLIAHMSRLYSEDLPGISLYFGLATVAHTAALTGPNVAPADSDLSWNVHEWAWR